MRIGHPQRNNLVQSEKKKSKAYLHAAICRADLSTPRKWQPDARAPDMSTDSETSACKITPLYAPNMFLSCTYTLEYAHYLKWRAYMLLLPTICFFWWKAMWTKATICCGSSSILLLAAASKCLKKRAEKESSGLKTNEFLVSKETVVLRRWERSKQKFGVIKRVDKGWITTVALTKG